MKTILRGCGRGGNKASQSNLRVQKAEYFLLTQQGTKWLVVKGPMTKGRALRADADCYAAGVTACACLRDLAMYHDEAGVLAAEIKGSIPLPCKLSK